MVDITIQCNGKEQMFQGTIECPNSEKYRILYIFSKGVEDTEVLDGWRQLTANIKINHHNGHNESFDGCRLIEILETRDEKITGISFAYGPTN